MTVLVVGGTGTLGSHLVPRLTARGMPVRILTRDAVRRASTAPNVELAQGDVREVAPVQRAMAGVSVVVSAVHGFRGDRGAGCREIDWLGNRNLIEAATSNGVRHFVLVSVVGAAPEHPMELMRMKWRAEEELKRSRLAWTIIRPTAYMETWIGIVGAPLLKGATRVFGRGQNPINFVSAADVARYVETAIVDPSLRGQTIDVGGPENLSLRELAATFGRVTGRTGAVRSIPRPMMRLMSALMRPIKPGFAREVRAGVVMDTCDMTFDPAATIQRYPAIQPVSMADVIRRDYVAGRLETQGAPSVSHSPAP